MLFPAGRAAERISRTHWPLTSGIVSSPSAAYAADTTGLAAAAPDKASDVVAASFTLTIDGAGTAIGSYQLFFSKGINIYTFGNKR